VELSQLILYHLLEHDLETVNAEEDEDEDKRVDTALQTIREWTVRKEWGEEEVWMERVLSRFFRGGGFRFDV